MYAHQYLLDIFLQLHDHYSQIQGNKNVTLNNTFNGIGKQDEAFAQNVGAMSYEQVIRAIGGGR